MTRKSEHLTLSPGCKKYRSNKEPTHNMDDSLDDLMFCNQDTEFFNDIPEDLCKLCGQLGSMDMSKTAFCDVLDNKNFESATESLIDDDGDSPLHIVIILKDMHTIMALLGRISSLTWLNLKNKHQQTPLHLAVLTRLTPVVKTLVTLGADVMSRDREGNTSFHLACKNGFEDIVSTLLQTIQCNQTNKDDRRFPFQHLCNSLSALNYHGASCLHLAGENGFLGIVKMLIDNGADCNVKAGKTGRSILHDASFNGNLELVKLLTQTKSCNINAKAFDGLTPFDLARSRSHDSICMVLAAAGARYGYEDIEET